MNATPAGTFVIKEGKVRWQPAVDPNRVLAAVAAAIVAVVVTRGWMMPRIAKIGGTDATCCT